MKSSWLLELDRDRSSYLLLATLAGIGLIAGVLYRVGFIGWVLQLIGIVVRGSVRLGFQLWERAGMGELAAFPDPRRGIPRGRRPFRR